MNYFDPPLPFIEPAVGPGSTTYANQRRHARKLLAQQGPKALEPHASIGRECGCGGCFTCAANSVQRDWLNDPLRHGYQRAR